MISVLCTTDPLVRDAFANALSLEKTDETSNMIVYQRSKWVFVYYKSGFTQEDIVQIGEHYTPDRLYIPYFANSIDTIHEVGDILVPNVFFTYDPVIERTEVTEENHDRLMGTPRFLTHLEEQKDYLVEDYGLSLGGIVVQDAPEKISDDLATSLMMVYEADGYIHQSIDASIDIIEGEVMPAIIITGIMSGKPSSKHEGVSPIELTVRNMITTIRLLEEE